LERARPARFVRFFRRHVPHHHENLEKENKFTPNTLEESYFQNFSRLLSEALDKQG
jgi:hypothetical protein